MPLAEVFATLPKFELNSDSDGPILESKNEFLTDYLVDGNFDLDCDMADENDEDSNQQPTSSQGTEA